MEAKGKQGSGEAGESKIAAAKETVVEKVKGVVGAVASKVSDKLPGKSDEDQAQAGTPKQQEEDRTGTEEYVERGDSGPTGHGLKLPSYGDEEAPEAAEDLGPQGEGGYPYREGGPADLSGEEIAPQGEGVSVGPGQGKGIGVPGAGGQAKVEGKDLEVEQSPPT